jgi:hypothetical protein
MTAAKICVLNVRLVGLVLPLRDGRLRCYCGGRWAFAMVLCAHVCAGRGKEVWVSEPDGVWRFAAALAFMYGGWRIQSVAGMAAVAVYDVRCTVPSSRAKV